MPLITRYRIVLGLFMVGLVLSGITAFPLAWELNLITKALGIDPSAAPDPRHGLSFWISNVNRGLNDTYAKYPWMAYGTDWLAFAHIAIAVYFIGPMVNPSKNEWVITAGLIGCVSVIPLALICGLLRDIPFYWRLIDCSFGVFGALPLLYCRHLMRLMKSASAA